MLLRSRAITSLNIIEKIQPRMMVATFNGNPSTTIISCYSSTNVSEKTDLITFYDELSSLVHSIIFVIGRDMNAQIGKNVNHKFRLHNSPNRNGQHLTDLPSTYVTINISISWKIYWCQLINIIFITKMLTSIIESEIVSACLVGSTEMSFSTISSKLDEPGPSRMHIYIIIIISNGFFSVHFPQDRENLGINRPSSAMQVDD